MDLAIIILAILLVAFAMMLFNRTNTLSDINYELQKEIEDTKRLRRQEVHNNTVLLNKNRELKGVIEEIKDIISGPKTLPEKEDIIKRLLFSAKNNNPINK